MHHPNSRKQSSFVLLHRGPSCTAVKLQHTPSSPDQKKEETQGFSFSVDTLDINSRLIVKEKCEDWSEVKKTETVRASELHAGNTKLERASRRSLPSLLWLMFRQKDAPLYNGCWQSSCLTGLCFDSAHCFQRTALFLFFLFCGEVHLFLQCPSPCLAFPSGFLWFLRHRVLGLQLLDTSIALSERPVCLLYLWNSEKQAGPAGPQHQIYMTWEVRGEFRPRQACSNISTLKNIWL